MDSFSNGNGEEIDEVVGMIGTKGEWAPDGLSSVDIAEAIWGLPSGIPGAWLASRLWFPEPPFSGHGLDVGFVSGQHGHGNPK